MNKINAEETEPKKKNCCVWFVLKPNMDVQDYDFFYIAIRKSSIEIQNDL